MILAQGLRREYGPVVAVDHVDMHLAGGQVVGFLGPNGAGKTTTLRMIVGALAPTAGWVAVAGHDVMRDPARARAAIGYLPESTPLYTEMRVSEFLGYRARMFGIARSRRRRAVDVALRRCWLDDVRGRPIHQLSKGYRQRVGLAAALLHEPAVLILDEPTVGLDPTQIREVRSLIRELAARHTVLLSTHILPEVELTCDRIVLIARGRVRAQGTLDEMRQAAGAASPYLVEVDSGHVVTAIEQINGVREVEMSALDGRWKRLVITPRDNAPDLRESIATAVRTVGAMARELRQEAATLEHLFIRTVAEAELDHAARQEARARAGRRMVAA